MLLLSLIGLLVLSQKKRTTFINLAENASSRWAHLFHQQHQPKRIKSYLAGLFNAVNILLAGGWRGPLLGAVLNVAFDMLTLYLLFFAARNPISLGVLLTGYGFLC